MKKLFQQIAIFICLTLIISCDKDQKLVGEIEGEYEIEMITNYLNGRGTEAKFTGGRMYFEDCKMKDGTGGNCNGWYAIDGNDKVTFQYNTRKEGSAKIIAITDLSNVVEPRITGTFKFQLLRSYMVLNGIEESGSSTQGPKETWHSDIRLVKKMNSTE